MRRTTLTFAILSTAIFAASEASAVEPYAEIGVGMPELAKIRAGALVGPRVSVEAYSGFVLFNWLVGAGATGYLLGETRGSFPPRHAMAVQGTIALNPTLRPIRPGSGGETIGAAFMANVGYAYTADSGFLARVWLGGILLEEDGLAGGPMFTFGVGWIFGARRAQQL